MPRGKLITDPHLARVMHWASISLAGLVALIGFAMCIRSAVLVMSGEKTEGEVTRYQTFIRKGAAVSSPVIAYHDRKGRRWEQVIAVAQTDGANSQKVRIVYNPNNPEEVRQDDFGSIWAGPIFVLIVGLLGCFIVWHNRRE